MSVILEPYKLVQPEMEDPANIEDINSNTKIISDTMKANADAIAAHKTDKTNPHGVTKAQVGLGNADNTSDANKPISSAQAAVNSAQAVTNGGVQASLAFLEEGLDSKADRTELDAKEDKTNKAVPDGYASLDENGKVPMSQINDAITGALVYMGLWDAGANTPSLSPGSEVRGHFYITSAAGTQMGTAYAVGDWAISNGEIWERVPNTDAVSSVNGMTGNVVITRVPNADTANTVLDGAITAAKIATSAVTNAKIAPEAVTTSKIMDGNIVADHLATSAVTNAKIAPEAVTTTKILDNTISAAKLGVSSVTNEKLAPDAVTTSKILDATITNPKLAGMAPNSIKGNPTSAVANCIDMSAAQARSIIMPGYPTVESGFSTEGLAANTTQYSFRGRFRINIATYQNRAHVVCSANIFLNNVPSGAQVFGGVNMAVVKGVCPIFGAAVSGKTLGGPIGVFQCFTPISELPGKYNCYLGPNSDRYGWAMGCSLTSQGSYQFIAPGRNYDDGSSYGVWGIGNGDLAGANTVWLFDLWITWT